MALSDIDEVEIPDSQLAREVTQLIGDTKSELLFAHSTRVYFWAALTGKRKDLIYDPELLYAASMFHDIGLTSKYRDSQLRFEVDGANAARDQGSGLQAHGSVQHHFMFALGVRLERQWLLLLNFAERSRAHFTAAHVTADHHPQLRAGRLRQGKRRRLRLIVEQALAVPEDDGKSHQPKLVHQPGGQQLAHQIGAALRQQVGAVLLFERTYCVDEVARQYLTVVPLKRVGSMGGHMLGHSVEQVGDVVVCPGVYARPVGREDVVGATPQQQLEWL